MTAPAEKDTRAALIAAAAQLLAEQGAGALTTRRLASHVGTSTMAVYTHFGSMDELRRAIRREGFERLTSEWDAVKHTRDPVADLGVSAGTYVLFALSNPNLYRAMFFETPHDDVDAPVNAASSELAIIQRCIDAGRFDAAEPLSLAWPLWAATHGVVAAVLAGVFDLDAGLAHLGTLGPALYVGFGDDPGAAKRSVGLARRRLRNRPPRPRSE